MATVFLNWDAVNDPSVNNYKVYYGLASRAYIASVSMGNILDGSITLSTDTWFIALTRVSSTQGESLFSSELIVVVGTPPAAFPFLRPQRVSIG